MTRQHRQPHTAHERGQSLIIGAFSIIALIGMVGLAVDVGLVYVERIRVRRAADAAALAAAADLPLERAAYVRALEYLEENSYPSGLTAQYADGALAFACNDPATRVEINAGTHEPYVFGPEAGGAQRVIQINTIPYRDDVYASDSANRIEVIVSTQVGLYFMRVLGFNSVPVMGRAVGENINNLDVALVFDVSGSMEFDTLCYGCWTPSNSSDYPEGNLYPLPWNGPADGAPYHCSGDGEPLEYDNHRYIIIEAEEYSRNSVPHDRDLYVQGMTYWVLQRNGGTNVSNLPGYLIEGSGAGSYSRDGRGGYVSHHPYRRHDGADGMGSNCTWDALTNGGMCVDDAWIRSVGGPFPNPRLDYDFQVPESGTWYVWARGTGGDGSRRLMWGRDRTPYGDVYQDSSQSFGTTSFRYNGARSGDWRWVKLGSLGHLEPGNTYELNIWAGACGFDLDRLIITTNASTPKQSADQNSQFTNNVLRNTANIDNHRTGQACDPCDVRFGGYPDGPGGNEPPRCQIPGFPADHAKNYRYNDWLFDDEQPIRGAKEAAARFIRRFDPRYDQVGLVTYSSSADIRSELECVRRRGSDNCDADEIEDRVVDRLLDRTAGGGTNIPSAIRKGIDVLSNKSGHYGRPAAAHIMVFMTDGETNQLSGVEAECDDEDYWPHNSGDSTVDRSKDCTVYYARQARNNGIVIYSITLGATADIELMEYIAELTGGVHRHAPRPEQLDPIFDELYKRIFLRLVE